MLFRGPAARGGFQILIIERAAHTDNNKCMNNDSLQDPLVGQIIICNFPVIETFAQIRKLTEPFDQMTLPTRQAL